jgi:hypothetical protein
MGQEIITSSASSPMVPVAGGKLPTPMELLSNALTNNASVDIIERLMALQTKWEEKEARKAFAAAIAAAKAEIPPLYKTSKVGYESSNGDFVGYQHEDLGEMCQTIDPILGRHGISYRYKTSQSGAVISMACIVEHRDGHCEETSLAAPADTSGKKNPLQSIGSTITYLQRYTLKVALGLAATKDDDANSSGCQTEPDRGRSHQHNTQPQRAAKPAPDVLKKLPQHTRIDWLDEFGPVMTPDAEVCGKIVVAIRAAIEAGTREALVMALQFHAKNETALKEFCQRNWEMSKSKIVNMNKGFDKVREMIAAMDVAPSEQQEARAA